MTNNRPGLWMMVLRTGALAGGAVGLFLWAQGPINTVTQPEKRRQFLLRASTMNLPQTEKLSPLAQTLRSHVEMLAETIGERNAFTPESLKAARDYILQEFHQIGLTPQSLNYRTMGNPHPGKLVDFTNVEVVLGKPAPNNQGVWIVGAHYDSAETPGADDNASGVAVLLELGRLLKNDPLKEEIRLVAFSTEEPPFFGTSGMGSAHYAHDLKKSGVPVKGILILEMLGYYNETPHSQLYPPFFQILRSNRGSFVAAVGNFSSRKLLKSFRKAWRMESPMPLSTMTLPSVFSSLAESDQLNFWNIGWDALMISDTAFYRNPHYHLPSDTPATLDYARMAQTTEALHRTIVELTHSSARN